MSLLEKEDFFCNLNMENMIDLDYMHAERVCKEFEVKNLGEWYEKNREK